MNIHQHAQLVRQKHDALPPADSFVVVSLENRDRNTTEGHITEVNRIDGRFEPWAAKLLVAGTHRLATPEETNAYRDDLRARTEKQTADDPKTKEAGSMERLATRLEKVMVAAQAEPAQPVAAEQKPKFPLKADAPDKGVNSNG